MDYERERRRQKRYREAMRNRIIAAVLLAGIIVGAIFIIKGLQKGRCSGGRRPEHESARGQCRRHYDTG